MMVVEAASGKGRRSERKRESTRSNQTGSMMQRGSTALSICLDPQERDDAVAQEAAQTSVEKGAHLGPSIEGDRGASVKAAWCGRGLKVFRQDLAMLHLALLFPWLTKVTCAAASAM